MIQMLLFLKKMIFQWKHMAEIKLKMLIFYFINVKNDLLNKKFVKRI